MVRTSTLPMNDMYSIGQERAMHLPYNPDWAIVFKGEKKIYFVAETKSEGQELRGSEELKIRCGTEHFKKFEDVIYKRVSSVANLNRRADL
ncbi:MAG: hypothetical protein HZC13_06490 [Nitrospirae bacterium]|nr:hypothetical protein [Nitrospirota bacterium]